MCSSMHARSVNNPIQYCTLHIYIPKQPELQHLEVKQIYSKTMLLISEGFLIFFFLFFEPVLVNFLAVRTRLIFGAKKKIADD